jgi:hypothetical protein
MTRISASLYRFESKPRGKSKRVSYSYLLTRRQGNLLICDQNCLVTDYLDEIEELGGIEMQLIPRYTDAKRGDYHDVLHQRFGCRLCYHEAERKMTRTKTKCPETTFGDDGLRFGNDFEAYLFPHKMHNGACLYRWRQRGRYLLFTSGLIRHPHDEWDLRFHPELWPEKRDLLAGLAELHVDQLMPSGPDVLDENVQDLTDRTRQSLTQALQAKLKFPAGAPKSRVGLSGRKVVTNYVSDELRDVIESTESFQIDKMKVHGNCSMSLLMTYLQLADIVVFQSFRRKFTARQAFLPALRKHVESGGGLLLADDRVNAADDGTIVFSHLFPEVGQRGEPVAKGVGESPELVIGSAHPITAGVKANTRFTAAAFEHKNHRHVAYTGMTYEPGPSGQVVVRNVAGDPVLVAGQVGKGRVILSGFFYGRGMAVEGVERKICQGALKWLVGIDDSRL